MLVTQLLDGAERKLNVLHTLDQILSARVDRNAVIGDDNIYGLTRSGYGGYIGTDSRDSSLQKRSNDDGALCSCCGIRMSALAPVIMPSEPTTTLQLKFTSTSRDARITKSSLLT